MKLASLVLAALLTSGCTLMRTNTSHDGLNDVSSLQDVNHLAGQAADRLAQTHAPAHTPIILARTPGAFGDALENGLRAHGFAVYPQDSAGEGLVVDYAVDRLHEDGAAPAVYARIRTSDGRMFSVVRRLRATPMQIEKVPGMTIVEPPFAVATPPPDVKETALAESPQAVSPVAPAPAEKAGLTPENNASALVPSTVPSAPASPAVSSRATLPLSRAVLSVLPYSWRYSIPDADRRAAQVGAPGNSPWREAVTAMARDAGCTARFDDAARRVTLETTGPLPAGSAGSGIPAVAAATPGASVAVSALHPASLPEPAPASNTPPVPMATSPTAPIVEPASGATEKLAPSPVIAAATVAATVPPAPDVPAVVEPTPPEVALALGASAIPLESWDIQSGSSLYGQLQSWGEKAGYQVIYKGRNDYMLETSATFRGTFFSAVKDLFGALHKGGIPLRATLHDGNNVLEIIEE